MNSKEALKRLKQETCPATYMADFDKNECIEVIKQDLDRLEMLESEIKRKSGIICMLESENESLRSENISMHNKVANLESENLTLKKIIKEKSKLEKELKQIKLNFKNSQIHSKNCYKNLKEKYNRLLFSVEYLREENVSLENEVDFLTNRAREVIEIMNKKNIHHFLKHTNSLDEYNKFIRGSEYDELTKGEFYSLKEYFGND